SRFNGTPPTAGKLYPPLTTASPAPPVAVAAPTAPFTTVKWAVCCATSAGVACVAVTVLDGELVVPVMPHAANTMKITAHLNAVGRSDVRRVHPEVRRVVRISGPFYD